MDQLDQLVSTLRKTIDSATSSLQLDAEHARALHRALALLWSAHDEIASLRSMVRRHA